MYIRTDKVLYTVKRVISGKHVNPDPGKKATYQRAERQVQTGRTEVHPQRQPIQGQLLQALQQEVLETVLQTAHHRATPIKGLERAAEAIAVVSWVGNHRLAARAANGLILTRRASSSQKKARPAARGVLPQKALHVEVHLEVAAGRKVALEVKKGVRLPIFIS
jgi:hypothetical protein